VLKRGPARTLAALALGLVLGCVGTVVDQSYPALDERRSPIRRIAVARLVARPEAAVPAAPVVARQLAEALAARGFEVVLPDAVATESAAGDTGAGLPGLAARLHTDLGVDALLVGEITRWVEREGSAAGAQRPASVGVALVLYGAPDAQRLWRGEFDRTQQPFTENVLLTPRYPGGGTRWLTASEFAGFAATELAAAVPLAP
jgi:hypothetical protein